MIGSEAALQILVARWDDTGLDPDFGPAEATNVFRGRWQDEPDEAVMLLDVPGPAPERTYGQEVAVGRPRVQVLVRATGYERAEQIASQAWLALTATGRTTTDGAVLRIEPVGHPRPLDRDERERTQFVFTCDMWM